MKRPFKILFSILSLLGIFITPVYAEIDWNAAQSEPSVNLPIKEWVESTATDLITSLAIQNREERFAHLRNLFRESIDTNYIARKVVGRAWRNFDENTKERHIAAFEDYILYVYAAKPINLNVTNFSVTGTKYIGSAANVTIATARADFFWSKDNDSQQSRELDFSFTISQNGSDFKILDISVGGISVVTFISTFYAGKLQANGGDVYYTLRKFEQEVQDIMYKESMGEMPQSPFSIFSASKPANPPESIQPDMMPYVQQ